MSIEEIRQITKTAVAKKDAEDAPLVEKCIPKVREKIREAAEKGKTEVFCTTKLFETEVVWELREDVMLRIAQVLSAEGYEVKPRFGVYEVIRIRW